MDLNTMVSSQGTFVSEMERREAGARKKNKSDTTVFVGNLPPGVSESQLLQCFTQCGEVTNVLILDACAKSRLRCAMVTFRGIESAHDAVANINGTVALAGWDRKIVVRPAVSKMDRRPRQPMRNDSVQIPEHLGFARGGDSDQELLVMGLPLAVDDNTALTIFSPFGKVMDVFTWKHSATTCALVSYSNNDEAVAAMNGLSGLDYGNGLTLSVHWASEVLAIDAGLQQSSDDWMTAPTPSLEDEESTAQDLNLACHCLVDSIATTPNAARRLLQLLVRIRLHFVAAEQAQPRTHLQVRARRSAV